MTETVIGPIDTIYKDDSMETVATEFNPVQRITDIENNISESLLIDNKEKCKIPLALYCYLILVIFSLVLIIALSVI